MQIANIASIVLAIIISLTSTIAYSKVSDSLKMNTAKRHLNRVINNASDSALKEATFRMNIDSKDAMIEAEQVFETFYAVFADSFEMRPLNSKDTLNRIYEMLPLMALVVNDGFYITYNDRDTNGKLVRRYTPKLPITDMSRAGAGIYSRSAYQDDHWEVTKVGGVYSLRLNRKEKKLDNALLDKNTAIIMDRLRAFVKNINNNSKSQISMKVDPKDIERYKWNMRGSSLIVICDDFDLLSKPIDSFTIAGTQLTERNRVLVYEKNGKKYYKFVSNIDNNFTNADDIYSSPEEALKRVPGLEPDISEILKYEP